jgi:uroporphyrinogen III methyltransferase/synthase
LLQHAGPDCEIIYAGKEAGQHTLPQDEINRILAEKACEGHKVCRLKGGDPFLFGRGGEECLYLLERGIPFEVVPGVTAALGATAYAGIPITHRGLASSVHIVTGHEDPAKSESGVPWRELARSGGTLVFYMGVGNLGKIVQRLTEEGRSPKTPAAVIANGTLPSQRCVISTLGEIAGRAQEESIRPPAILVVGEVVRLGEKLNWFNHRPLWGRSIIVTRARDQASELSERLRELGAEVIESPVIRIESLADTPAMRRAAGEVGRFQWVVFTSVNGVDSFREALDLEGLDVRRLSGVKIAAIGPATRDRLLEIGLRADLLPERFIAESLLEALAAHGSLSGQRVLLPRSEIARPLLAEGLRGLGADVEEVPAYRTLRGAALDEPLLERLSRKEIDLVTFTSSSTVWNCVEAIPSHRKTEILSSIKCATIGPITSQAAKEAGIEVVTEANEYTIPGLVEAILRLPHPASS